MGTISSSARSLSLQPSFQRKQFNGSSTSPTPYSNFTSANSTLARQGSAPGNNMSELDSLLQDLKTSKYGQSLDRKQQQQHNGEQDE